ncbi:MAG: adenylosuccinate synthetase, partial [Phycisphaerae bacterium]
MDFAARGNTCVVGLQWGDEGKGKIVDVLTEHFDVVVRYAGGANAGHTVRIGDQKFALHLAPSGILRPEVTCVIAAGVVLDPEILVKELDGLTARGIAVGANLKISNRAHLVMPYHKKQDLFSEGALSPDRKLGTTSCGIGPCYADKMLRSAAFRVGDLQRPDAFRDKLLTVIDAKNRFFAAMYGDKHPLDSDEVADRY